MLGREAKWAPVHAVRTPSGRIVGMAGAILRCLPELNTLAVTGVLPVADVVDLASLRLGRSRSGVASVARWTRGSRRNRSHLCQWVGNVTVRGHRSISPNGRIRVHDASREHHGRLFELLMPPR